MQKFRYVCFDHSGGRVEGELDAPDLSSAKQELKNQNLMIKTVEPVQTSLSLNFGSGSDISLSDLEFLTAELSVLLDAGLKIDKGIALLHSSSKKPAVKLLLDKLSKDIRGGKQLSQALAKHNEVFDPLYVNLVQIGEATGKLAEVFRSLAKDLAFRKELKQKVMQAMTYPMVILLVCLCSVLFIFNYVVPNMASLFEGQEDLPIYTTLLLSLSAWLSQYQWWLLLGSVVFCFISMQWLKRAENKQRLQTFAIKLPFFKSAILLIERIRFNSGLAMMLDAGVSVDHALTLACGSMRHVDIKKEVEIAIAKVKRGERLSACLRQTRLYPDFFASLLAVGEESGELGRIFNEIAQRSQKEFSAWVMRLTSLMEPLLIIVMGALVGGVVVVMMLSITSVSNTGL